MNFSRAWGWEPWSAEENDLVGRLANDGLRDREIGALLNRPLVIVAQKRRAQGLGHLLSIPWSQSEVELLRDLSNIFTKTEIATLLDRTPRAVANKLERLGIKRPASFYIAIGMPHVAYPPELREGIALQKQL
ncbi:hypothetical protein [Variovorax sp. RA8]|uniref:hypothetical protein n=1 Tax=Variovorax sp. (strain JCM 16519 / RA8) TaxID=662548 RepID=UPI0013A572BD|nr:hypothetical protein [Variovorax sp. RA8]